MFIFSSPTLAFPSNETLIPILANASSLCPKNKLKIVPSLELFWNHTRRNEKQVPNENNNGQHQQHPPTNPPTLRSQRSKSMSITKLQNQSGVKNSRVATSMWHAKHGWNERARQTKSMPHTIVTRYTTYRNIALHSQTQHNSPIEHNQFCSGNPYKLKDKLNLQPEKLQGTPCSSDRMPTHTSNSAAQHSRALNTT